MKLHSIGYSSGVTRAIIGRVTTAQLSSPEERAQSVLLWKGETEPNPSDYLAIITPRTAVPFVVNSPLVRSVTHLDYLADGDVVQVSPSGFVRTLYRKNSRHNFILTTDQCNSYCLMCSQPPKPINDFQRFEEHLRLIDLIDPNTRELGITGGEPTLFKDQFLQIVDHCKRKLPETALHVLSNGRLFFYSDFARRLAEIEHPDLMLGIPLYSDIDSEHDYVVQAQGAFEETVIGLHNLARYQIPVELRVVIHRQTYRRLPRLAEFIARNLPFAAQVALMGLEMTGFVNSNLEGLWIDPHDYQQQLVLATEALVAGGMNVMLYNQQLCVLDRQLWPFARKAISDWKNIYLESCNQCDLINDCGGLFKSSALRHSSHISPIRCESS